MAAEKSVLKVVNEKTLIDILSGFKFSIKDTNSYFGPLSNSYDENFSEK